MSVILEALARLKREITRINEAELVYDMAPLANHDEVKETFADPALLPADLVVNSGSYMLPARSPYTNHVVQATWNIAQIIENVATANVRLWAKATNGFALIACLKYLEPETYVFKIIDKKTYDLGLVLNPFLEIITSDEEAKEVLGGLATKYLTDMKIILTKRLKFFEAHTPDQIASTLNILQLKDTRLSLWHDEASKLIKDIEMMTLEPTSQDELPALQQEPSPSQQQLGQLDTSIANMQRKVEIIKQRITSYKQFIQQWATENQALNLPKSIPVSDYIQLLATPNTRAEKIIDSWRNLFNGDSILYMEQITQCFEEQLTLRSQPLQVAQDTLSEFQSQIELLQSDRSVLIESQQRQDRAHILEQMELRITASKEALIQINRQAREQNAAHHAFAKENRKTLIELARLGTARRKSLTDAHFTISQFLITLKTDNGLYIPANTVPKHRVLELLESKDSVLLGIIDKAYEREKNSHARRGFNLTFLGDLWYSKTTGTDYLKSQRERLIQELVKKQTEIQLELAFDQSQPASAKPEQRSPVENNLYHLQEKHRDEQQQLLARYMDLMLVEMQAQAAAINHQQAQLARWSTELEFRYVDCDPQITLLHTLLRDMTEMPLTCAIERYNELTPLIEKMDLWLRNTEFPAQKKLREYHFVENSEAWRRLKTSFMVQDIDYWPQVLVVLESLESAQTLALIDLLKNKGLLLTEHMLATMSQLLKEHKNLIEQYEKNKQKFQEIETLLAALVEKRRSLEAMAIIQDSALHYDQFNELPDSESPASIQDSEDDNQMEEPLQPQHKNPTPTVFTTLASLRQHFFGPTQNRRVSGIFGTYLEERADTFWLTDLFSRFAAFTLGCFGYKTEAEERKTYLVHLQKAIDAYEIDSREYDPLNEWIEYGLETFTPRTANKDDEDYHKSLHAKLEAFQEALDPFCMDFSMQSEPRPLGNRKTPPTI